MKRDFVSIILVNWNGEDDTIKCIESLNKMDYPVASEFIYYNGFRGPIKIWNVSNYPEGTETHDVFWNTWDDEADINNYGSYDFLFE